ncbi:hypothetical protein DIPPA_14274 [Diplonema papillatum]|nr:hypothetical protein DIPPA_14274 [Diplonema papillatum]
MSRLLTCRELLALKRETLQAASVEQYRNLMDEDAHLKQNPGLAAPVEACRKYDFLVADAALPVVRRPSTTSFRLRAKSGTWSEHVAGSEPSSPRSPRRKPAHSHGLGHRRPPAQLAAVEFPPKAGGGAWARRLQARPMSAPAGASPRPARRLPPGGGGAGAREAAASGWDSPSRAASPRPVCLQDVYKALCIDPAAPPSPGSLPKDGGEPLGGTAPAGPAEWAAHPHRCDPDCAEAGRPVESARDASALEPAKAPPPESPRPRQRAAGAAGGECRPDGPQQPLEARRPRSAPGGAAMHTPHPGVCIPAPSFLGAERLPPGGAGASRGVGVFASSPTEHPAALQEGKSGEAADAAKQAGRPADAGKRARQRSLAVRRRWKLELSLASLTRETRQAAAEPSPPPTSARQQSSSRFAVHIGGPVAAGPRFTKVFSKNSADVPRPASCSAVDVKEDLVTKKPLAAPAFKFTEPRTCIINYAGRCPVVGVERMHREKGSEGSAGLLQAANPHVRAASAKKRRWKGKDWSARIAELPAAKSTERWLRSLGVDGAAAAPARRPGGKARPAARLGDREDDVQIPATPAPARSGVVLPNDAAGGAGPAAAPADSFFALLLSRDKNAPLDDQSDVSSV